ncbi:MAG: M56 family metallopeptidase [Gemmatimonadaceae bacterium]|nr:M56 family metallopeptidase [Gemmatimonadaceae bacterium]
MIAVLIAYGLVVAALVGIACHLLERLCLASRVLTRAVWMGGILLAVALPATTIGISRAAQTPVTQSGLIAPMVTGVRPAAGTPLRSVTAIDEAVQVLRSLDTPLGVAWGIATVSLLIALAFLARRTRRIVDAGEHASIDAIPVRITASVGPAIVGIFSYYIVVPRWVIDLPDRQRSLIVEHERMHARAFDPLLVWFSALMVAAFPWNIALWSLMRRLRTSIEMDCDNRVLEKTHDVDAYASVLLDVSARFSSHPPILSAALTESASQLKRRIVEMSSPGPSISRVRLIAGLLAVAVVSLAATSVPRPHSSVDLPGGIGSQSSTGSVKPNLRSRSMASVTVESAAPVSVLVYTTELAGIKVGAGNKPPVPDTINLRTPARFTAALDGGAVHIVSFDGSPVSVKATFTGSPALRSTASFPHTILLKGGLGVSSPLATRASTAAPQVLPADLSDTAYFEYQVEDPASEIQNNPRPKYPASLRAAGTEGDVMTQFVVDREGKPEPATFRVLKSPSELFSNAVLDVLPNFRYQPATISGKPVRQVVQQAFLFRLDSTKPRQPPTAPIRQ